MKNVKNRLLAATLILGLGATNFLTTTTFTSAADAPGTQITNNASAIYTDGSGHTYQTTSNTVTTQVQNAPVMTMTSPGGGNYVAGQEATDTYTLTNSGNASGTFNVGSGATFSSNATNTNTSLQSYAGCSAGTAYQYVVLPASSTTCFTSYTALQTYLTANPTAAAGSTQIVVIYTVNSGAAAGTNNLTSSLTATVAYAAAGGAPAETSASVTTTPANSITTDPRMDLYKASSQNGTSGDLTYTIYAHNGGGAPAKDLQSVKTLLGSSAAGIFISDKVPTFGSPAVPLALSSSGTVTVTPGNTTYGFATGATESVYYSTSASGASWTLATGNLPTNGTVTYIGILISGGSCTGYGAGYELCADSGHPTNPGNSNVTSATAAGFSFVTVQPSGPQSGNPGAVTNLANAVVGDPLGDIIGPNIPANTADGGSLTAAGEGINNTTSGATGTPTGASNIVSNNALALAGVFTGPVLFPESTGSYDGIVASNQNDDFTAYNFGDTGDNIVNTSTTPGTPTTTVTTGAIETVCIAHTLENSGNVDSQTYNITANIPTAYPIPNTSGGSVVSGWTVGIYSNSACTTVVGGASPASPSSTATAVGPGSSNPTGHANWYTFYVGYSAPAGVKYFNRFDADIHAVATGSPSTTNDTHDELYAGFIALTKSDVITPGCPTGQTVPAGGICSGGTIAYSVDYRNLVMGTSDNATSFAQTETQAGTFSITDDGSQSITNQTSTPNWATFATATTAAADTASNASSRASSTFAYYTGVGPSGGTTGGPTATFGPTVSKIVCNVGGASFQLVPKNYFGATLPTAALDWQGTLTFTVTAK